MVPRAATTSSGQPWSRAHDSEDCATNEPGAIGVNRSPGARYTNGAYIDTGEGTPAAAGSPPTVAPPMASVVISTAPATALRILRNLPFVVFRRLDEHSDVTDIPPVWLAVAGRTTKSSAQTCARSTRSARSRTGAPGVGSDPARHRRKARRVGPACRPGPPGPRGGTIGPRFPRRL